MNKLCVFLLFTTLILLCSNVQAVNISFISPTLANNSVTNNNYVEVNASIYSSSLTEFIWNWNGTNYTFLNSSCVLHMDFENNSAIGENSTFAVDVSQQGNNGSFTGDWTSDGAISLNGTTDYVNISTPPITGSQDRTIIAWVKTSTHSRDIVSWGSDASGQGSRLGLNADGKFFFGINGGYALFTTVVTDNEINCIGIVLNGTRTDNVTGYFDGDEDARSALSSLTVNTANTNGAIGRKDTTGDRYFEDDIYKVLIYDRGLSTEEMKQIYLSNLEKYNSTYWYFESNQTNLSDGEYNYQAFTSDVESDYRVVTVASPYSPTVTLLSQTPSIIYTNSTGYINISYGITHSWAGLNNTSVSFIYRNYDWDLSDSNHSIRPPSNNLASEWNFDGRILRGANRNETPSLNFDNNDTITGGDTYTWSGLDENSTKLTIVPVNSTYTKVYINATVHCIMPQMWYLDRTDQQQATKTQLPIHKTQNVLIKFWNFEIFKGNTDFLGVGYTDTSLHNNPALWPSNANLVNFYYVNSSYDPTIGGDPLTSGYAVYMGSLNASGWTDHVYSRSDSNYVRGFIDNNYLHTVVDTTNISYLYFTSNTESSKPYYINMTNVASSTNVSFANTNTLWAGNTPPYTLQAYTPNIWFAFMKLNMSLDHKLYAADNNDLWGSSSMNRTNITQALFPPTTPVIDHFHFLGETDYDMDGVYYGNFSIGCGVSSDPDGGDVTHNLTLHYANNLTFVAIINNTFTDKNITHNGVYFDANFSSIPYYSQTVNYTLRLIATDDESETVTVWLGVNFSLDGSPRIISYSPGTPVSSSEGENQTFSITTNLIGNVTWYLDSVEVFNETDVNSSSYSNENASLGTHNVTVITTNTNGSNSMMWNWNVRTELWAFVEDSITWGISVAQYLVSNIGVVIVTAFSLVCILILMMLIGAALSVTKIIYR